MHLWYMNIKKWQKCINGLLPSVLTLLLFLCDTGGSEWRQLEDSRSNGVCKNRRRERQPARVWQEQLLCNHSGEFPRRLFRSKSQDHWPRWSTPRMSNQFHSFNKWFKRMTHMLSDLMLAFLERFWRSQLSLSFPLLLRGGSMEQ